MGNQTVYPYGQDGQLPSGYPIADDLNTDSAQQALSAKQGVILKGMIDSAGSGNTEVDMLVDMYAVSLGNYINATNNVWASSNSTKSFFVPIEPGKKYKVVAGSSAARVAILSSNSDTAGNPPSYATGETQLHSISANTSFEFTAQSDAHYLSINKTLSDAVITPSKLSYFEASETAVKDYTDDSIKDIGGEFEEEVDYDTLTVLTNNTTNITITKDGNGAIIIENTIKTTGKYALIELPSTLRGGAKYRLSFDYDANFTNADTWWLAFADSNYAPTSGGVSLYPLRGQSIKYDFTYKTGDVYLRLASNSQTGAYVRITKFSISSNKTTVAELSSDVRGMIGGGVKIDNLITQAKYVASSPTTQSLALLHFTDIHGDSIAADAILDFYEKNSSRIDDMIQTGDAVYYYWNSSGQGYTWFQNIGIAKSLFVLGNHDGAADDNTYGYKEGSADWDFKGKEWDFDTYFADYIAERGVTPPSGYNDSSSPYYKACYWHKDYASAKVRLIGLDCMHFNDGFRYTSNDQETWLAAKLQETLTSGNSAYGYSVIFMCHYAIDDFTGSNETWDESSHRFIYNQNATGGKLMDYHTGSNVTFHYGSSYDADKRFCMRTKVANSSAQYGYDKGNDNPIADVIQTWINNGGKYVAWVSGHTHTEYAYYPAKYPSMLCVGLSQAGNARGTSEGDRSDNSAMHTSANLYVIDTQNKLFKIIRFGKTLDRQLISLELLCYNYDAKTVIANR